MELRQWLSQLSLSKQSKGCDTQLAYGRKLLGRQKCPGKYPRFVLGKVSTPGGSYLIPMAYAQHWGHRKRSSKWIYGEGCLGGIFQGNLSRGMFRRNAGRESWNVWWNIGGGGRNVCRPIPMQDYKSLRVAIMIYVAMVNTQTHRQLLTG